ncbi:MAG TPA: hypothetical protein VGH62_16240 [Bradyrhizobium sp.]|jgi:class 3 adenylate cyclase
MDAIAAQSIALMARNAPKLAARIGIHTGPVVLSEDAELYAELPSIAARVQAAAEPGMVEIFLMVSLGASGEWRLAPRSLSAI